jgi:hypothetical protein
MSDLHAELRSTSDEIARLMSKRPAKRDAAAWRDNLLAACRAGVSVAQRLESSTADDSNAELLRTQLELLSVLVSQRDPGAIDKLRALVDRMRTIAVPEITTEVWLQDLRTELEQSRGSRIQAHRVGELVQVFSAVQLGWRHLLVARQALRAFGLDSMAIGDRQTFRCQQESAARQRGPALGGHGEAAFLVGATA